MKRPTSTNGSKAKSDEFASDRDDSPKFHLRQLRPFMTTAGQCVLTDEERLAACARASLIKAFEFCTFAHSKLKDEFAFHCVAGLRSICEDLIILKFISTLPPEDQKILLNADMVRTMHSSMRDQSTFFDTFRPGQPVLRGGYSPNDLAKLNAQVDDVWHRNGWPLAKRGKWPPTEQLARKIGQGTVDVIYNYIFRLTSSTVHFSTQALLRTGWGVVNADGMKVTFSTKHMSKYYVAFCQIYGIFLLSIYFEFFPILFDVTPRVQRRVEKLRMALAKHERWPEMLTFEEANKDMPAGSEIIRLVLRHGLAEEFKAGFISGSEKRRAKLERQVN